jgi:hypothetical protein
LEKILAILGFLKDVLLGMIEFREGRFEVRCLLFIVNGWEKKRRRRNCLLGEVGTIEA